MNHLASSATVFVLSAKHQINIIKSHPLFLIGAVVQPVVFLVIIFMTREVTTAGDTARYAVAVLLICYWGATVWQGAGILHQERNNGTLKSLVRSVHSPQLILLGKAFGATIAPALLTTLTIIVVLAGFGLSVRIEFPGWFLLGTVVVFTSGAALGTMLCSLFLLTRHGNYLSTGLLYPVYLISGLLIPVTFWPGYISWLSWPISLRWGNSFLVGAAEGNLDFGALMMAIALTILYGLLGYLGFRAVLKAVLKKGTLDVG